MSFNVPRNNSRVVFKSLNPDQVPTAVTTNASLATSYSVFTTNTTSLRLNNTLVTATATELNKTNVTPGTSTVEKPLVLDSSKNLSGLNSITCNSLIINGNQLGGGNNASNQYLSNITPGTALGGRALVVNSNKNITNLNDLSSITLGVQEGSLEIDNFSENDSSKFVITSLEYNNNWTSICWADKLSLFIAVANTGTGNRIMTSPDGITWTLVNSPFDNNWSSITWSNELSLLVAVANTGTGNRIMTSPDGQTWTLRNNIIDNNWSSVCWSYGLNLFIAVSNSGLNDRIITSPNGITWTSRTSPLYNVESNVLSNGVSTTLFVMNNGTIRGIGINSNYQLLDGTTTRRLTSVVLSNLSNVISVVINDNYALALINNGTIRSWGSNSNGQLGDGTTTSTGVNSIPSFVSNINNAIKIDVGISSQFSSFALLSDGTIRAWGDNSEGQLGINSTIQQTTPTTVSNITTAIDISAGAAHVLALLRDGSIRAWGRNSSGQLGDNSTTQKNIPTTVIGITNAIKISAGFNYSVALLADGTIRAWGSNSNGQLGDGTTTQRQIPVAGPNLSNILNISTAYGSTYALINDGTIRAWGWNNVGQLGNNSTINSSSPVTVQNVSNAVALSNAKSITMSALLNDGTIKSWGRNDNGQLGDNTTTNRLTAVSLITSTSDSTALINIRTTSNINWNSVCYSPDLNLLVAVGNGDYINRVMTSSDGINWTLRVSSEYGNWRSVCWASELGLFIAVASSGPSNSSGITNIGSNRVMTSPNGITWTSRTIFQESWTQVIWSSEKRLAMAICENYSNTKIAISRDGINWRPINNQNNNPLNCICWSNTLKKFAILSRIENRLRYITNWALSPSTNSATECRNVFWINELSIFIMVGVNKLLTSSNGTTWTNRTVPNLIYYSVAYSSSLNRLIVVGEGSSGGTSTNTIITSTDNGVTWSSITVPRSARWISVVWSPELSLFVAVSQNTAGSGASTSGMVITSTNGTTWTSRTATDWEWSDIIWINTLNLFVCVGTGRHTLGGNRIMTSPDGINWTIQTPPIISNWKSVAWSPELGLMVTVADFPQDSFNQIAVSTNGIDWISVNMPIIGSWWYVTWAASIGLFVAVGEHTGQNFIIYSADGYNWTALDTGFNIPIWGIDWSPTLQMFILAGKISSNDNIIRSVVSGSSNTNINSLLTNNTSDIFNLSNIIKKSYIPLSNSKYFLKNWYSVNIPSMTYSSICCPTTTNKNIIITSSTNTYYSTNSVNWSITALASVSINTSCYSPDLDLYVILGNNIIRTSTDGFSWNTITSTINNNWTSICWSPELMQFAAVSNSGINNRVMISYDGTNWYSELTPSNNWTSICWSPYLQLYAAVASSGTNRVMTSSDGILWTARNAASNLNWTSVCWATELLLFVAVASSGTGNRIMTSPDGITWTSRSSPADNNWNSIIYVSNLRLLLAIASSGDSRLMYSDNGINWKLVTLPVNNNWIGITWSNDLQNLMIISSDGTNRLLRSEYFKPTNYNSLVSNRFKFNNNLISYNIPSNPSTHQFEIHAPSIGFHTNSNTPNAEMAISASTFTLNNNNSSINISDNNGSTSGLALNNTLITLTGNQINGLSGLTLGIASASKPLLLNSLRNISDINEVSCNSLTINSVFSGLTAGSASVNKPLIADSNKNISGLNLIGTDIVKIKNTNITAHNKQISGNTNYNTSFNKNISGLRNGCWVPELSLFVIGSVQGVRLSSDGYSWNYIPITGLPSLSSIAWSPELKLLIAVDGSNIYTSVNGINWNQKNITNSNWNRIIWISELSKYFIFSNSTNDYLTSTDGLNWTTLTGGTSSINNVIYAKNMIIILTPTSLRVSTDGVIWTNYSLPNIGTWQSIAYSPTLDLFVIVANLSNINISSKIITSNDLINWTYRPYVNSLIQNWNHILWINELNLFIAVSNSGNINSRIMISYNGIDWFNRGNSILNANFTFILWSPQLSRILLFNNNDNPIYVSNSSNITKFSEYNYQNTENDINLIVQKNVKPSGFINKLTNNWISRNTTNFTIQTTTTAVTISGGRRSSVALTNAGTVFTWGENGTWQTNTVPTQVSGLTNVISISAGYTHILALLSDGTIKAWGNNEYGELGYGTTNSYPVSAPVTVSNINNAIAISAGNLASFALLSDGTVRSWGFNGNGQLGIGNTNNSYKQLTPIQIDGLDNVTKISTGFSRSVFAILSDGTVKSWGSNNAGQLGINSTINQFSPISIPNLNNIINIAVGESHTLALLSDGTVKSWGSNWAGQLGINSTIGSLIPVDISSLTNIISISAGGYHSIAYKTSSTYYLWGYNYSGQLAVFNNGGGSLLYPTTSHSGPSSVVEIKAGDNHTIALRSDGTIRTWGNNDYYQLGINQTTNINSIATPSISNVKTTFNAMTTQITYNKYNWTSICRSEELDLFVAVSSSGTGNRIATSSNGITWTSRNSASDNNWTSVCWSPELSLFVTVANSGTGNRVMTSSDGITWTSRTSASDNDWTHVIWVSELTLFIATASSGTDNRIMTSLDGINWTSRTSAANNNWTSVCWAQELSLLVAVASSGTGNRVMTSPDGINWTSRTSAADNNWTSVCWADNINKFIAVANSGNNRVMTSIDGINWEIQVTSFDKPNWIEVIWIKELNYAVAISNSGNKRIMISNNGIDWYLENLNIKNNWTSLCWSSDLGILCAVSNSDTNTQFAQTLMVYPTPKNALIAYPNQLVAVHNEANRGRIGLGMTPSYQLQLSTDSAFKLSTTTWTVSSDSRLKEDIEEANLDECYNNIKNLPLKRYKWKDDIYNNNQIDDRSKLGWIADDVQQIIPKAVKEIEAFGFKDCKSLDNDQIIANLYGCIKKLSQLSEDKKNIIQQLETKLNTLKNAINNLEIVEE